MFPEFEKYAKEENLLAKKLTGSLDAKLPRILGQGKTKAMGLDILPAPIERKQEYVNLDFPPSFKIPKSVIDEQSRVRVELEKELKHLCSEEGSRSLASNVIRSIKADSQGIKNNYFFADGFLLIPDKKRTSWSWSITPHYPVIEKIPPDFDYLVNAFSIAKIKVEEMLLQPEIFEKQLELSWQLAGHFNNNNDKLLLSDVARFYIVAAQGIKFWGNPQKKYFTDVPDASFIANLVNYKRNYKSHEGHKFEFTPATLNDSYRKNVYHIPTDREGTQTRPYVYIQKIR